jgi:hypothetical protein
MFFYYYYYHYLGLSQVMPGAVRHPQYGLLTIYLPGRGGGVASRNIEMGV